MNYYDYAFLRVELNKQEHSMSDARIIIDALDGIACAAVWGALFHKGYDDRSYYKARDIVTDKIRSDEKAGSRFYPIFFGPMRSDKALLIPVIELDDHRFEPTDPLDAGARDGINSWLRRTVSQEAPEVYSSLFSFAQITRAEHHSPLLLELGIALAAGALPAFLALGIMRMVVRLRKENEEAEIRGLQKKVLSENLKQEQLKTKVLEQIHDSISENGLESVPKEALVAAAATSTTAVADLASSPLIGNLTFGMSVKSG